MNLETEYKKFFNKKGKYPKYKSKKKCRNSYTSCLTNNNIKILETNKRIQLPKIGKVKAVLHRLPKEGWIIKSATVSKNCYDQYYVSILFEFEETPKFTQTNSYLALDYKSSELYVDSNNHHAQMPHYYKLNEKKLARAQRKLSKKKLHSNNWYKQAKKVNKILLKIANQRNDFLHKESRKIANSYYFVFVEDLNMQSVSHSLKLGKSTLDNGFGKFRELLSYKLEAKGGKLIKIDKRYPSTKTCSRCGRIKKISLSERTYCCDCGLVIDRDYNAALNLLSEGIKLLGQELPEVTPVEIL
jgi:putative transposase